MAGVRWAAVDRGVMLLGCGFLLIALAGSAIAWRRWERVRLFAGDIPLPPGSQTIATPPPEASGAGAARSTRAPCTATMWLRGSAERVESFFDRELDERGWQAIEGAGSRLVFRSGRRTLRVAIRPVPTRGRTNFTLTVRPCTPAAPPR